MEINHIVLMNKLLEMGEIGKIIPIIYSLLEEVSVLSAKQIFQNQ